VGDCYAYVCIHNPRLHSGALIFCVDFEDAIHARKGHQDATLTREGSAGKAGAGAAAHYGNLIAVRDLDDTDNVGSRSREGDAVWPRDLHRTIVFVEQQFFRAVENRFGTQKLFEFTNDAGIHGFCAAGYDARTSWQL
jgi:hypothetical protein